jgi:hypothetical protein
MVAKSYCDCMAQQLANAKDSSVDVNNCQRVTFSQSRLLMIYADCDRQDKYSIATLDSAESFATLVCNMEDSLCNDKMDRRKIKRFRCRLK